MGKTTANAMTFEDMQPRKVGKVKKIKVTSAPKVKNVSSRKAYKEAKSYHKEQIRLLKTDIKKHKLLIKQAKLSYKLSK